MASEDAQHSSGRLSSISVYEDPPVTDPEVINRQLDSELQLKNHIGELIKLYLDSDSLDKVEELTEHQLSCCGRITGLRLQLLRLRRSSTISSEDINITVENLLENPLDILMMASEEDAQAVVISPATNGTVKTDSANPLSVPASAEFDVATTLALKETAKTIVSNAITNSIARLSDQTDSLSVALQQFGTVDKHEKVISEVETVTENKSISNKVGPKLDVSDETLNDHQYAAEAVVHETTSPPAQPDKGDEQNGLVSFDADSNIAHQASSDSVEQLPIIENVQSSLEDHAIINLDQAVEGISNLSDKLEAEQGNDDQVDEDSTKDKIVEENTDLSAFADQQLTKDDQSNEASIVDQPVKDDRASKDLSADEVHSEVTESDQDSEEIEHSKGQPIAVSPATSDNLSKDVESSTEDEATTDLSTDKQVHKDNGNSKSQIDQVISYYKANENMDLSAGSELNKDKQTSEETKLPTKEQLINDGKDGAAITDKHPLEPIKDEQVSENTEPSTKDQSTYGDHTNKLCTDLSANATGEHKSEFDKDALVPSAKNPTTKERECSQIVHNKGLPAFPMSDSQLVQSRSIESSKINKQKSTTLDGRRSSTQLFRLGKKQKTLTGGATASVTPLAAFSTFEWDPSCLIEELYIDCKPIASPGTQPNRLVVAMEKLPRNQEKKTIAKGWKKRFFCITSGNMYYYEEQKMTKALGVVKLSGAKISCQDLIIRVTDKMNQTIVMRGKPEDSYQMYRSLQLESVHPTLTSILNPYPGNDHPVIIVDIGSCSVRAGFASGDSYPNLFFPAVCSVVKDTDEIQACGMDALLPSTRQNCEIVFPTRRKLRMDQDDMTVTLRYIHHFLLYIFRKLKVEPSSAKVLMTLPQNYSEKDKEMLMELLLENLSCEAVSLQEQHILSLYSYGATAGIVVDIGDRTDIVPIVDGFKIDAGVTKLQVGGSTVTESLRRLSTEYGLRYFSEVEFYIMRLVKEKLGFVSQDFATDMEQCTADAVSYTRALEVDHYQLPDRKTVIAMSSPLFRAFEGFFRPSVWGKDIPSIPESILKAIQSCDVDRRREMARSIFLSGGATLTTGFQERLEQELRSISPSSYNIQIQASVSRHHAAFLGAAVLVSLDSFQNSWITKEQFAISKT